MIPIKKNSREFNRLLNRAHSLREELWDVHEVHVIEEIASELRARLARAAWDRLLRESADIFMRRIERLSQMIAQVMAIILAAISRSFRATWRFQAQPTRTFTLRYDLSQAHAKG